MGGEYHSLDRAKALSIAIFAVSLGGKVEPVLSLTPTKNLVLLISFDTDRQEDAFWWRVNQILHSSHYLPLDFAIRKAGFAALDVQNANEANFEEIKAKFATLAASTARLAGQKAKFTVAYWDYWDCEWLSYKPSLHGGNLSSISTSTHSPY